jgi:hypothetical protein
MTAISPEEMLDAHEQMFGEAGRQCAKIVLHWARVLFVKPLEALKARIVLAPVELGPYNRHVGYHYGPNDEGIFIFGNRHIVELQDGTLVLKKKEGAQNFLDGLEDFIVHELTHARQAQLERQHGWKRTRGAHRDLGWYAAVAEACPNYLGFELPPSIWPQGPRKKEGLLTEVEMTHWPESIRLLATQEDERLPLGSRADVRRFRAEAAERSRADVR